MSPGLLRFGHVLTLDRADGCDGRRDAGRDVRDPVVIVVEGNGKASAAEIQELARNIRR